MLKNSYRRLYLYVCCAALLMGTMGVAGLHAQVVSTATVLGTVTDASGAAVAGAMITVKNTGTGITNNTVSDAQGRYRVQDLIIGMYEVDVEAAGFQRYVHSGIVLDVGSQAVVDAQLAVGTVQQTVTVESDVTHVETTSVAVTNLVEQKQLEDLPLNGRNYYQLVTLAPGVMLTSTGSTFYGNQANYSISGTRPSGQAYLVDDTNTGDFWNHSTGNGTTGTQLGVESIAEFSTALNTYGAQYGGNGAAFNATTKSGTNNFHGSAYEYLLNSSLSAANNFIPTSAPLQKAFDNKNQFGMSIGGPIKKNKAFFFFNYEGLREQQVSYSQLTEPDLNARGCSGLSVQQCQADGGVGPNVPLFANSKTGVLTAVPFAPCGSTLGYASNLYPMGNTCAAAENIMSELSVFPIGTLSDNAVNGTALTSNVGNPTHIAENYFTGRFDYTISDKDTLFVKQTIDKGYDYKYGSVQLIPEHDFTTDVYTTIEERRIFSPTFLNVFHVSYVRPDEEGYQNGNPAINLPAQTAALGGVGAGQPYANCFGCATNAAFGFFDFNPTVQGRSDNIAIGTGNAAGISINGTQPFYLIPNNFTLGDDVIWTKGSHSIKFGMNVERMDENTWAPFITAGSWGASNNVLLPYVVGPNGPTCQLTGTPPTCASSGIQASLAAFIAGQFTSAGPGELPESVLAAQNLIPQDGTIDARETLFSPYFQDDWKVSARLTLNLGVRYSPTRLTSLANHINENLLNAPWDGAATGSFVTSANSPIGPNGQPSFPSGTNCLTPTATSNFGAPLTCGWVPVTHPFAQNISLKNIDPRVGVAWDPFKDHKTSVRAGLGLYHVVIIERDWDMWIQPPALPGTESIPNSIPPGSPQTFPFEFSAGSNPVLPCALSGSLASVPAQPVNVAVSPLTANGGVNFPTAPGNQFVNCLSVTSGGATYYGATKTPYDMQYNINVQREILPQTIVTIGFVGNRGVDLVSQRDFNSFTPCGNGGQPDPLTGQPVYVQGFTSATNSWEPCPRLNPTMGGVSLLNPSVPSWYNALQVSINRRFSKGFQVQASYSWQKSVDIVDGSYGLDGGGSVTDPYNYNLGKGNNSNNRPMLLTISTLYQLPFHRNQLVSGWQVTGIFTYLGGAPFNVSGASRGGYGATVDWAPNNPGCNGNVYTGVSPDVAANRYIVGTNNAGQFPNGSATASIIGDVPTADSYLNPNCFSPAPAGEPGNLGKNTFYGPTDWNLDMSLLKDTKITKISESFNLQFRAEFFNVFNHPYWSTPSAGVFSACNSATCGSTGGITTAGAALEQNNGTATFGGFGNPSSTPRRMQFALRVTF